jgi:hypothetical protein
MQAPSRRIISPVRLSLKTINAELAKRSSKALLVKGDGYFYFVGVEADDWLDRTIRVPTLQSLSLEQWIDEFQKLSEQNRKLMQSVPKPSAESAEPAPKARKLARRRSVNRATIPSVSETPH